MKNNIQHAIDQIGIDAVRKSIGTAALGSCDIHGHYALPLRSSESPIPDATCPICTKQEGNGTTATEIEHFIDIKEAVDYTAGNNPGQKANPYGI